VYGFAWRDSYGYPGGMSFAASLGEVSQSTGTTANIYPANSGIDPALRGNDPAPNNLTVVADLNGDGIVGLLLAI